MTRAWKSGSERFQEHAAEGHGRSPAPPRRKAGGRLVGWAVRGGLLALLLFPATRSLAGGPAEKALDELFVRDQPSISTLVQWDGGFIVQAEGFYSVDVEKGTAAPFGVAAGTVEAAVSAGNRLLLLVEKGGKRTLHARDAGGLTEIPIPPSFADASEPALLAADAGSIVLLRDEGVALLEEGRFDERAVGKRPGPVGELRQLGLHPHRVLLNGGRLYLGYAHGEWGGALISLHLSTGEWSVLKGPALPIVDLALGPDGKLWVVEGRSHMGLGKGVVSTFDGKRWTVVTSSLEPSDEHVATWNLPATAFVALEFDGGGRPVLLTSSLGLVKRDGDGWRQVTETWKRHRYLRDLRLTDSGVAVIATYDAGVLIWDLGSGRVRRVALRS